MLALSVDEATAFFAPDGDALHRRQEDRPLLKSTSASATWCIGQPLNTLSGGESQRLKLATQMGEKGDVYIWTSRRPAPGRCRPALRLRTGSSTTVSVIVIEHHQADGARRLDHRPRPGRQVDGRLRRTPAELAAQRRR